MNETNPQEGANDGGTVTPQNEPVNAQTPSNTTGETGAINVAEIQRVANEAAEKKSNAVFKSMLEQQGYTKEEVPAVVKEWKEKQMTPEKEMALLKEKLSQAEKQNGENELRFATMGKGVPADKVPQYIKLAESYTNEETEFTAALDKAIEAFPFTKTQGEAVSPTNVPSFASPTAGAPDKENDPFIMGFKKGLR